MQVKMQNAKVKMEAGVMDARASPILHFALCILTCMSFSPSDSLSHVLRLPLSRPRPRRTAEPPSALGPQCRRGDHLGGASQPDQGRERRVPAAPVLYRG